MEVELVGAGLYALAFNRLILPLNLYSGNLTGVAQVNSDLLSWEKFVLKYFPFHPIIIYAQKK